MSPIPVLGFAAYSGTGKTTLIEQLVQALKAKGLRLAVIKHDGHDFEIDRPGKDSYRYTKAGADQVILSSCSKTVVMEQSSLGLSQLVENVRNVDLILVEGFKSEPIKQIGIFRKASGNPLPAAPEHYLALVTDEAFDTSVPQFSFEEIPQITEFIMKQIKDFTHFNEEGKARMVDVGTKDETRRTATAAAKVYVNPDTFALIASGGMKKGDVLTVAQIAGIMGAKRTPDLIPMCHPVAIDGIDLKLTLNPQLYCVEIQATASCTGRTGVEMEALTAASTAALTVYDMCKAVQKDMIISDLCLLSKTGGVHGDFFRKEISTWATQQQ